MSSSMLLYTVTVPGGPDFLMSLNCQIRRGDNVMLPISKTTANHLNTRVFYFNRNVTKTFLHLKNGGDIPPISNLNN